MSLPQLYVIRIIALLQKHFILLFLSYKSLQQKNRRFSLLFLYLFKMRIFPYIPSSSSGGPINNFSNGKIKMTKVRILKSSVGPKYRGTKKSLLTPVKPKIVCNNKLISSKSVTLMTTVKKSVKMFC